jgi:hypothetical protein
MKSIGKFLDIEAEEASDLDEDEFDEEEHDFIKKKQQENQFYAEGELAKRHTGLNRDFLDGMANRYKDLEDQDEDALEDSEPDQDEF